MDCPHCNASNPVGTETCGSCRTPLIDSGATLVAQMTPPVVNSDAMLIDSAELRRYKILESMAANSPPSMEIPKDWSIPPASQILEEARNSRPKSDCPNCHTDQRRKTPFRKWTKGAEPEAGTHLLSTLILTY
jgi:hypothetical protein